MKVGAKVKKELEYFKYFLITLLMICVTVILIDLGFNTLLTKRMDAFTSLSASGVFLTKFTGLSVLLIVLIYTANKMMTNNRK